MIKATCKKVGVGVLLTLLRRRSGVVVRRERRLRLLQRLVATNGMNIILTATLALSAAARVLMSKRYGPER